VSLLVDVLTAVICRRRDHRWAPFNAVGRDPNMRWAERDYCTRCEAHRLRWLRDRGGEPTGEQDVFSRADVLRLAPRWLEGLYRARWGEYPRSRVVIGGEFPADWVW
jgi:hypothetical protein